MIESGLLESLQISKESRIIGGRQKGELGPLSFILTYLFAVFYYIFHSERRVVLRSDPHFGGCLENTMCLHCGHHEAATSISIPSWFRAYCDNFGFAFVDLGRSRISFTISTDRANGS